MPRSPGGSPRAGGERRQHPRAEADWSITVTLADGPHPARLRDVSRAGVCFFLDRPIALMSLLALSIELPGSAPPRSVRGGGAVVRCERISPGVEHFEIAVFLHDVTESDLSALEAHVRRTA